MSKGTEYIIEEFKTLRDEIKRTETSVIQMMLYVLSGILVAFGLTEKSLLSPIVIPILIQFVLIISMNRYFSDSMLRLRLSTYIEVMLEPKIPGLNWESRNSRFKKLAHKKANFFITAILWFIEKFQNIFFLLAIFGLYISIQRILELSKTNEKAFLIPIIGILGILHIVNFYLLYKCTYGTRKYSEYIAIWEAIKAEEHEDDDFIQRQNLVVKD